MTDKELNILKKYFKVDDTDNGIIELEAWTDRGVDMFIRLSKHSNLSISEQLNNYICAFDIDNEIDLMRESVDFRENFTIRESLEDFEGWLEFVNNVIKDLESLEV